LIANSPTLGWCKPTGDLDAEFKFAVHLGSRTAASGYTTKKVAGLTMNIEHPNTQAATPEEDKELQNLKLRIEQLIGDGILTHTEYRSLIDSLHLGSGDRSADQVRRVIELYRSIVTDKLEAGDLEYREFD
jgi:hypothetical protein